MGEICCSCVSGVIVNYLPVAGKDADNTASVRVFQEMGGMPVVQLFGKAKSGDEYALNIIDKWSKNIVCIIKYIIALINPPKIVIGGGVSAQGDFLIKCIEKNLVELPKAFQNSFELTVSKCKNDAGIIGAVKLISEKLLKL